jgi:hypothetical protein
MESESTQAFVKLIREFFRLQAEVRTLAAILQTAEQLDQPPIKWLEALKQARTHPNYRNISEQYAPLLDHIEQSAQANELDRLIKSIPPTQFLN